MSHSFEHPATWQEVERIEMVVTKVIVGTIHKQMINEPNMNNALPSIYEQIITTLTAPNKIRLLIEGLKKEEKWP